VEWFLEFLVWQGFRLSYPGKPDKDLNGLTTTGLVVTMPGLPAAISVSLLKPSTVGRDAITPSIWRAWRTELTDQGI